MQKCNQKQKHTTFTQQSYGDSQPFDKRRQSIQSKVLSKSQVLLNNKIILYELLQSNKFYDMYMGIQLKHKNKVVIKIFDKTFLKQILQQDSGQSTKNQKIYTDMIKKIKLQCFIQTKLYNQITGYFMIRCEQVIQNSDCIIKVCQDYYDETLETTLKRRNSLAINEALAILKQIIMSLSQFHQDGIIFTQLKPQSIVYKNGIYRIHDFSSIRKISQSFNYSLNFDDSPQICAPQLIICPHVIDMKSQIWALGLLFYRMIAHNLPYENRVLDILKQVKTYNIVFTTKNGFIQPQVTQFLRQVLAINPDERISWKKLMNHVIFEDPQYFYSMKNIILVDARDSSLKKKDIQLLPQQIQCQYNRNYVSPWLSSINSRINKKLINKLFQQVSNQNNINLDKLLYIQDETFILIKCTNLMVLKAAYIYKNIIQILQKNNMLDQNRRSHVQFQYLMTSRCFDYIKCIYRLKNKTSDRRIQNYIQQTKYIIQKIEDKFKQVQKRQSKIDRSTYYVSSDLFSTVLKKNKLKQKSRFFKGRQGIDYQINEQIQYTQQKYINKIINQLQGSYNMVRQMRMVLVNYDKINYIQQKQIQGDKTYAERVQRILKSTKLNNLQ